jgi:hypothetical protein
MERKIGEIFKYKGVSIKCVKSEKHDNCNKCYFKRTFACSKHSIVGFCGDVFRSDHTEVHFVIAHPSIIEVDDE